MRDVRLNKKMNDILSKDAFEYFFGDLFSFDVAVASLSGHPDLEEFKRSLINSISQAEPHIGVQLIGYENVDTGLSMAILMKNPNQYSMVSFFVESHHSLFGGSTLACVPFAFCSQFYKPENEYCVYRHTFKEPNFNSSEIKEITSNGSPEQRVKAFAYTKSRDGYTTVPCMTYVGITKRQ